jgi:uncharacterized protein YbaR (Trm112 family)
MDSGPAPVYTPAVAIDPRLLELLVCPACRADVKEEAAGLACVGCGRVYPVRDGIPVMLAEEATPPRA